MIPYSKRNENVEKKANINLAVGKATGSQNNYGIPLLLITRNNSLLRTPCSSISVLPLWLHWYGCKKIWCILFSPLLRSALCGSSSTLLGDRASSSASSVRQDRSCATAGCEAEWVSLLKWERRIGKVLWKNAKRKIQNTATLLRNENLKN